MTAREERIDGAAAICPACGYEHGDCWELCPQEHPPTEFECDGCGAKLKAHAEYQVDYHCYLADGGDQ